MVGIRSDRLTTFVQWVNDHVTGDEKGQAQIFLDRLFQAFGHAGCLEVGGTPEFRIRKPKEDGGGTAFADYVWKPVVLIEMKKQGENLARHYRQAFDYWTRLVPGRPRYAILCNFDEFWVFDFETQMDSPVDRLTLEELPRRYGPLAFLFPTPERPVFGDDHEAVTRQAADHLATCFNKLINRADVQRSTAQRFILQILVALFAEDIGLLQQYLVSRLLEDCQTPQDSYDLLGGLFVEMNTPGVTAGGRFKGVDYFNGGLFAEPARLELHPDEVNQLKAAAKADWSKVRPEIFGTLFEHSMESEERHAFGAHFTSAVDIMKIVGPTIVTPWRELIENATSRKRLLELRTRLTHLRVLDPACGSGNFLYIAYREMKRLEGRIFERIAELSTKKTQKQKLMGFVTANQFYGIDINPFAVELAKVTMMIARKLAIDELKMEERPLPLDNLDDNFHACDALLDAQGNPSQWPAADVIIGNPPFLGAKRLKPEHGPDYVNKIRKAYPAVPGMADYCVYWFRKSHDHLPECSPEDPLAGRAGLVGTQNIRNNKSRVGGLDHVVKSGTIIEAVDNQPWSGEANVHVSIANWVKHPPAPENRTKREQEKVRQQLLIPEKKRLWYKVEPEPGKKKLLKKGGNAAKEYELSFRFGNQISAVLSDETDVSSALILSCNTQPHKVFQGVTPGHDGFVLSKEDRKSLIHSDRNSDGVIFPYVTGQDLLVGDGTPKRFLIDFMEMDILEAQSHIAAFAHIESNVLADLQRKAKEEHHSENARKSHLDKWWMLWRSRSELIAGALRLKNRFVVCSRVTKRPIFVFLANDLRPSDKVQSFLFDDDYSFGILQSFSHWQWFFVKCSKLKSDFSYSTESVFNTFPWPQSPTVKQIKAVAEAGREVRRIRSEALTKIKGGLRAVYRTLELPGKNPLKDAHAALDAAVLAAYGFSAKQDLLEQLLHLNQNVAERIQAGETVISPGIPPNYPKPADLVTEDCIEPPPI